MQGQPKRQIVVKNVDTWEDISRIDLSQDVGIHESVSCGKVGTVAKKKKPKKTYLL